MDAGPGPAEADRPDVLTTLVEGYRERGHPVVASRPGGGHSQRTGKPGSGCAGSG